MYGDWGYGRGGGYMGGVGFILCMALLALFIFWIVRVISHHDSAGKETPLEILDHRFARGEIDLESYTRDRAALKSALGK
jgi:putative membrane protein